jgi:MerR family mercuric resistance operon transcriptional regulator
MPAFAPVTLAGLAELSGVDVESIERYQARRLLPGPRPSRGGSGDLAYHEEHLARLCFIRRALELGFDLGAVEELVDLDRGSATRSDVHDIASRRLARLRAELAYLQSLESEMARLAASCPRKGPGKDCPILAGLRPRASPAEA